MCGGCLAHIEFRNQMEVVMDLMIQLQVCHVCGKTHKMAVTPFPEEEGWPCCYDASKEAFAERVRIVVMEDPEMKEEVLKHE